MFVIPYFSEAIVLCSCGQLCLMKTFEGAKQNCYTVHKIAKLDIPHLEVLHYMLFKR